MGSVQNSSGSTEMNANFTAIAASIAASANANASAGIAGTANRSAAMGTDENRRSMCIHNVLKRGSDLNSLTARGDRPPSSDMHSLHQIGTNLADLSVCWHKISSFPDHCEKCGGAFYKGLLD